MTVGLAATSVPREASAERNLASWRAASISAALHGSLLAAFCGLVAPQRLPPEPPPPSSFAVVLSPPPAPAPVPEQMLQAARIEPAPQAAPLLAVPVPLALAPSPQAELHAARPPRRLVRGLARPAPAPQAVAAPHAPAQPAMAPAPASQAAMPRDVLAGLEARIRQAVQEAAIYPASARAMHLEGRTQVRFDYTDGAVNAAGVASSSTSPMLDRAALAAVRAAALPRAPAEIGARRLPLLVWVEFRLVRQD